MGRVGQIAVAVLLIAGYSLSAQTSTPSSTASQTSAQSSAGAIDVLSNTQGVNFGPYLKDVKDAVRKNWYRVIPLSVQMGRQGKVSIEFIIRRDGRVKGMTLSSTSGRCCARSRCLGGDHSL
jgi:outer membrane biosynthesis protein TonB